ncbi:hypothetical protein KA005_12140, partial [bacterium]|nr:hypothetical protein [bacterium]
MRRLKYITAAATIIGVFSSLHGGLYNLCRDTFFPSMKLTNPVLTAWLSSLIISGLAFIIIFLLGFLWMRFDLRRKRSEMDAAKQWFNDEAAKLIVGMRTLVRELNIELNNYTDCQRQKNEYNWSGWDRLVDIWELVKGSSSLYNIGSNPEIEKYIDRYPKLWGL